MRCSESQLTPHPPLRGPKLAKSVCFSHSSSTASRSKTSEVCVLLPQEKAIAAAGRIFAKANAAPPYGRCWFYPPPPFQGPSGRPVPTISRASIQSHATSVGRGFISRRRNDVRIVRYTAGRIFAKANAPSPTAVVLNRIKIRATKNGRI